MKEKNKENKKNEYIIKEFEKRKIAMR